MAPHRFGGGPQSAIARRAAYFLLRRWTRVRLSSLRCFFFAIRLRRFLITEPTTTLAHFSDNPRPGGDNHSVRGCIGAHTTYEGLAYPD